MFSAGLVKAIWRRRLAALTWVHLSAWASASAFAAQMSGFLAFGRDGRTTTYALVVLACALGLWWAGLRRR
jgi:hypothetical protein